MGMSEHSIQSRVVQFIKTFYPDVLIFSVPNGAAVSAVNRVRLAKEGLLAGIPDLFILEQRKGFNGLMIEFKTDIGKTSKSQDIIINKLIDRNYLVYVARGHLTAINIIEGYLNEKE